MDNVVVCLFDWLFVGLIVCLSVPMHMQALMHQNLAVSYYEEGLQAEQHSKGNKADDRPQRSEKSLKEQQTETAVQYFQKAEEQIARSVSLFEILFADEPTVSTTSSSSSSSSSSSPPPLWMDSSAQLEFVHSLQLQAGIVCALAHHHHHQKQQGQEQEQGHTVEAEQEQRMATVNTLWTRTIARARRHTGGLAAGVHFERLGVVLFNAALCHAGTDLDNSNSGGSSDSADAVMAQTFLDEAEFIVHRLVTDKRRRRRGERPGIAVEDVGDGEGVEWQQLQTLLQQIQSLRKYLAAQSQSKSPRQAVDVSALPKLTAVQTPHGVKYLQPDHHLNAVSKGSDSHDGNDEEVKVGAVVVKEEEEEEEWEECTEFDTDGCETFLIDERPLPVLESEPRSNSASVTQSDGEEWLWSPELYEGLDDEEIEELVDVRRRYAAITASSTPRPSRPPTTFDTKSTTESIPITAADTVEAAATTIEDAEKGGEGHCGATVAEVRQLMEANTALVRQVNELRAKLVSDKVWRGFWHVCCVVNVLFVGLID
jgi:hypothetical protein